MKLTMLTIRRGRKLRDKYIEVEAIDINASKKAAETAIAAYNKLGDAARTPGC